MNDEVVEDGQAELGTEPRPLLGIDVTDLVVNSPVFARLVEEVRSDQALDNHAYNRMHNRHNRSR